jgi:hypothetical protein
VVHRQMLGANIKVVPNRNREQTPHSASKRDVRPLLARAAVLTILLEEEK